MQGIKTGNSSAPIQQQRQPQQLTALNSLLGQSVAQIQNLQLNGNLAQLQMPNGMNGQFISQLPAQFQPSLTGFNQLNQGNMNINQGNLNLNQISNNNLTQIAAAAAAAASNASFQSPPPSDIQFAHQIGSPPPQLLPCVTPEPLRNPTPIMSPPPQSITINQHHYMSDANKIQHIGSPPLMSYPILHQQQAAPEVAPKPKRAKKSKKKQALAEQAANAPTGKLDLANVMKLCGIMEDDDFMDETDQMQEEMLLQQQHHQQSICVPTSISSNSTDIMITIPGQNADTPFTFTIPTTMDNASEMAHKGMTSTSTVNLIQSPITSSAIGGSEVLDCVKNQDNMPFMIRIDPSSNNESGQPFTISIPHLSGDHKLDLSKMSTSVAQAITTSSAGGSMCVPSFVNNVLNSSVTPTLQSQINEIQNQLMAAAPTPNPPLILPVGPSPKAPRKKAATKKSKKMDKAIEAITTTNASVPTQIGNIQISQIDGSTIKNSFGGKNIINNQIQIMPIIDNKVNQFSNLSGNQCSGMMVEKNRQQVPGIQNSIAMSHPQQNQNHNQHHHQQHHQSNQPSQVNINVQQNQLINVTNNLQMQVISNPSNSSNNSNQSNSSQQQHGNQASHQINAQNLIGNILNNAQNMNSQNMMHQTQNHQQQSGNIIIQQQGNAFNTQHSMPGNIQVNIQNQSIANNMISSATHQQQGSQQQTSNY